MALTALPEHQTPAGCARPPNWVDRLINSCCFLLPSAFVSPFAFGGVWGVCETLTCLVPAAIGVSPKPGVSGRSPLPAGDSSTEDTTHCWVFPFWEDLPSKVWVVLSVGKNRWKPALSHIPVCLLFLWRENICPKSQRKDNPIPNEKSWSKWLKNNNLVNYKSFWQQGDGALPMSVVHFLPPIQKIQWKAEIVLEGTGTKAAAVKLINTVQGLLKNFQEQSKCEVSQNHVFSMCALPKVFQGQKYWRPAWYLPFLERKKV